MPAVFDEQARHLGPRVERLTLQGMEMTETAISILKRGANAFLLHHGVMCLGFMGERAVLNAELLEKCAQSYILASLTRQPIEVIPAFVRFIATLRLRRDQKRASKAYARGEVPVRPATY
jgi:ribulose-5-phosphate 4-epimerase/fuculose-1-phosphate aldolase